MRETASKVIKGITIAIGGDASGLTKELGEVDGSLAKTQKELREVEKGLKLDPGNTELMAQQQELLGEQTELTAKRLKLLQENADKVGKAFKDNDAYQTALAPLQKSIDETKGKLVNLSATEKRLKAQLAKGEISEDSYKKTQVQLERTKNELNRLKNAKKELDESFANGHIDASEYRAYQREIIKTKQALDKLTKVEEDAADEAQESTTPVEELRKGLDQLAGQTNDTTGEFTIFKGALADMVADGAREAISEIQELATAFENTSRTLQAQTGASDNEMADLNAQLDKMYSAGYGEGIEDIGAAMGTVAQNTKETDPDKIAELTQNALVLRDTFDFDVAESMRAANMLIDQFGIDGEEAFNLIAQGAQNGLNKNGDLLDTINEYGVHYAQQGYSAEQFFNSLENGAAAGTFSIDKLGDAMKEFGIRTKDTATTTTEGFNLLGLDADEMRAKFAEGGASAQEATAEVLKRLYNLDDQVKQNQAGVDLFGTMWEDLGIDGVKALANVQGSADKTADTMAQITKLDMGSTTKELEALARQLKTEVLKPLIDEAMPQIKAGINWAAKNTDKIKTAIIGIGSAWAAAKLVQGISNTVSAAKNLKNTLDIVRTTAGNVYSGMSAGTQGIVKGMGAVGTAITIASLAGNFLKEKIDKATEAIDETAVSSAKLTDAQQDVVDAVKDTSKEIADLHDQISGDMGGLDEDTAVYDTMVDRLYTLDEQASLTSAEQAEMSEIIDTLNGKYSTLNLAIDETTGHLNAERASVEEVIESYNQKAKAEAMQENLTKLYKEQYKAKQNQTEAEEAYTAAQKEQKKAIADYNAAVKTRTRLDNKMADGVSTLTAKEAAAYEAAGKAIDDYTSRADTLDQNVSEMAIAYNSASSALHTVEGDIKDVSSYLSDNISTTQGSTNAVEENRAAVERAAQSTHDLFIAATNMSQTLYDVNGTIFSVSNDAASKIQEISDAYKTALDERTNQIYGAMDLFAEFSTDDSVTGDTLMKNLQSQLNGLQDWSDGISNLADRGISEGLLTKLEEAGPSSASYVKALVSMTDAELKNYSDGYDSAYTKAREAAEKQMEGLRKSSARQIKGILQDAGNSEAKMRDAYEILGKQCIVGFTNGIGAARQEAIDTITDMSQALIDKTKEQLDIHSPSRVFKRIGVYIPQGMAAGIEDGSDAVERSASSMAAAAVNGAASVGSKPYTFAKPTTGTTVTQTAKQSGSATPSTAVFQIVLPNGAALGEFVAPYVDIANGARIIMKERGHAGV